MKWKDDSIAEYKERLRLAPTDQTKYLRLSNEELRIKAVRMVDELRMAYDTTNENTYAWMNTYFDEIGGAKTEEERREIYTRRGQQLIQTSNTTQSTYNSKFKVELILLKDELLSRLPVKINRDKFIDDLYEIPTNPLGLSAIINDFEKLTKMLP